MEHENIAANVVEGYIEPNPLAVQIGITRRTLDRWYALRIGPPRVQIGRKILYRVEAVQQWLLSREESQPRAKR
jgi:predicted DNA-binding transcriptional regulator AlpA